MCRPNLGENRNVDNRKSLIQNVKWRRGGGGARQISEGSLAAFLATLATIMLHAQHLMQAINMLGCTGKCSRPGCDAPAPLAHASFAAAITPCRCRSAGKQSRLEVLLPGWLETY